MQCKQRKNACASMVGNSTHNFVLDKKARINCSDGLVEYELARSDSVNNLIGSMSSAYQVETLNS